MNTTTTHSIRRLALVGLLAAVAGLALWLVPFGVAIDQVNDKPAPLGLVGLTAGQTLRISFANVISDFDPQPDPPGKTCSLAVGFVDPAGRAIGNPHIFELRPGEARSFDFVAIGNPNIREYVRPVAADQRPKDACPAVISGEILDRDGINGIIVYDSVAFTDPWLSK